MPEMDGLELCHHIKNDINLSHIPVILLTAKSTEDNIITGLRDGADDYITKPFNLYILKLRIEKMIKWTDNNHREFIKRDIAPSEITVSSLDEQLITKAIQVVEDNMSNSDFSVEDFSAAVGMTRSHLYKKLMAITGKSPLEFIRIIRIKRGRSLLEQGRTNISEVAYTIGFSPKQFSKYFKEEYGYLPSEFLLRHN
jgi:AraC-like DNA-binding protein